MEEKPKAKIVKVGIVVNGQPMFWSFDCQDKVPAIEITAEGQVLTGGYSIEKLQQISNETNTN